MSEQLPTLFVCHGDDGGPKMHPCRRVQEALRAAEVDYEKVIAAHGRSVPVPAQRLARGASRRHRSDEAAGTEASDGTVITHSRSIRAWIAAR